MLSVNDAPNYSTRFYFWWTQDGTAQRGTPGYNGTLRYCVVHLFMICSPYIIFYTIKILKVFYFPHVRSQVWKEPSRASLWREWVSTWGRKTSSFQSTLLPTHGRTLWAPPPVSLTMTSCSHGNGRSHLASYTTLRRRLWIVHSADLQLVKTFVQL